MADGSIIIETELDNKKLESEYNRLVRKIQSLNDQIYTKQQQKLPLVEQSKQIAVELDKASAILHQMQTAPKGTYDAEQIKEQTEYVRGLTSQYNQVEGRIDAINRSLEKSNIELARAEENAGDMRKKLDASAGSAETLLAAQKKVNAHSRTFASRMKEILSGVLFYNLISSSLTKFTKWLGSAVKTSDEASAAISKLKGALLTMVQPILNVIIPAFTTVVNILTKIVSAVSGAISAMFGTTASDSAEAAKSLYDEQKALEGVGDAADEASGSLAGFDEINTLSSSDKSSANKDIVPDFSGAEDWDKLDGELRGTIGVITSIVGGAVLAIGAVLAFSGINIPLGISLMAVGAMGLASVIAANWGKISELLQDPIGVLLGIVGGALLVIGAILAFSGANLPLGLGLISVGAAGLAASIAANWDAITAALQGPMGLVDAMISGALLAIGAILTFSGVSLPLGIALMAVGAMGLVTVVAVNWETISESLGGTVDTIAVILGAALLVIGSILAFSGANLPLGLGLMIAGTATLATEIAANWDVISETMSGTVGTITAIVSGALLALGMILLLTGAGIPLGLGLIAVGAVGLATSISANWDDVTNAVGNETDTIAAIIGGALLVLGIILLFTGAGIPLGLGLIFAGATGLVLSIVPNWNTISDAVKNTWKSVKDYWNNNIAKYFKVSYWEGLGSDILSGLWDGLKKIWNNIYQWVSEKVGWIIDAFSGTTSSVSETTYDQPSSYPSTSSLDIPALAQGAVVPRNREFLAVLGDNKQETEIVSPLSTMKQAMIEAMQEAGGAGGSVTLVVNLDGREIARNTVRNINTMTKQSGKSPLLI